MVTTIIEIDELQMDCQLAGKSGILESSFNNGRLEEQEGSVEKVETIGWPSIFGGTSIY
jgi:hypothetical protein